MHIHVGTSCATEDADKVGDHYYNTTAITEDPWTAANGCAYSPTMTMDENIMVKGDFTFTKDYGYTLNESMGHVVIIHDNTGGRIGCGVLADSTGAYGFVASLTLLFAFALKLYL